MSNESFPDREILTEAQAKGTFSTILAFFRLSGPGWLQSAITLGSGSLVGALYLGMLGGTSMLWLQLVAIVIGVIMLSAIAYVTLSTNVRPYRAINEYVNPVLGVGWIGATILANMIWIMPQFSLCYDALDTSLLNQPMSKQASLDTSSRLAELQVQLADENIIEATRVNLESEIKDLKAQVARSKSAFGKSEMAKVYVSAVLAIAGLAFVLMKFKPGWMAWSFDTLLKLMVAMIVFCFVGVVYILAKNGALDWNEILMGFIPNINQWNDPAPAVSELLQQVNGTAKSFWEGEIRKAQHTSIIGVTATAVGLNMTFMLPYTLLAKGWDKPFRGFARFELVAFMAIPYLVVTTCIVIASAHAFHAKADEQFLSDDPAVMTQSVLFDSTMSVLEERYLSDFPESERALKKLELNGDIDSLKAAISKGYDDQLSEEAMAVLQGKLDLAKGVRKRKIAEYAAALSEAEKKIAPTMIKPNASQFAATLKLLLGPDYEQYANLIFGVGAFAMGFSTIVILSLINALAFSEILSMPNGFWPRFAGALVAIVCGFLWFYAWEGESKTWLVLLASTFGAILLPIAYISFFALMNNSRLLGANKPSGISMVIWNVLMFIGIAGALIQAIGAISDKVSEPTGPYVLGGVAVFLFLAMIGFSATRKRTSETAMNE